MPACVLPELLCELNTFAFASTAQACVQRYANALVYRIVHNAFIQ